MRSVLTALALLLPVPAPAQDAPHPALIRLIPLVEVYEARPGAAIPGFDVAGIRCGGLVLARDEWARANPGAAPVDPAERREAETNLAASEIDRRQRLRASAARAADTTRQDLRRVIGLYLARFEQNRRSGRHPWQGDTLIDRDTTYCGFLNRR